MDLQEPMSAASMAESKRAIEAILLVSSEPTPSQQLAQLLELSLDVVEELLRDLARGYEAANHGFQMVEVAGGWRYQTHPDLHPYVERFAMDGQSTRLSSAALETMAIVAYKQPISRAQVSAIRGVNVDAVLRTLVQRGYVEEVGRDAGVGQAVLFGTTQYFLERVGLPATADLPPLGEFVPAAEVVEALEQSLRVDLEVDPELTTDAESADDAGPAGLTAPPGDQDAGHRMAGEQGAGDADAGDLDVVAADGGEADAGDVGPQVETAFEVVDLTQMTATTADGQIVDVSDLDEVIDLDEVALDIQDGDDSLVEVNEIPTAADNPFRTDLHPNPRADIHSNLGPDDSSDLDPDTQSDNGAD